MKKVLITGGSSGLGKAMVERYAGAGDFFVYFTYAKSEESAKSIEASHSNTKSIKCDFRDANSVKELCDLVKSENIDILINNAITLFKFNHFHKSTMEDVNDGFNFNVSPVLNLLIGAVKVFRKRKYGKIINVLSSSVFGTPIGGFSLYIAEKKYIESISKSIAFENNKFNVQINCVSPSLMKTDLKQDHRVIEETEEKSPGKQLLQPKDVAEVVFSLTSNDNVYLNGQNINLNAGR